MSMQKFLIPFLILVLMSGFVPLSQYLSFATHTETGIGEINGIKWDDANGDGIFDLGESVLENVTINLTTTIFNATAGNFTTTIIHQTNTDIVGVYNFTGLELGQYAVSEIPPLFSIQTFPTNGDSHVVDVTVIEPTVSSVNFGNQLVGPSQINGTIFEDVVNIGTFDAGDTLLSGAGVQLFKFVSTSTFPQFVAFTNTDLNGDYGFVNLEPGVYSVTAFAPFSPNVQTVPINNQPSVVTLSGQMETGVNIGFDSSFGTITGKAFIDSNENGILDVGELYSLTQTRQPSSRCMCFLISG